MNDVTTRKVLEELKVGNYTNFNQFYEATSRKVFVVISALTRKDIDDIMQDAYCSFISSVGKVSPDQSPISYLCKIAHNTAINYLNQHKRVHCVGDDESYMFVEEHEQHYQDNSIILKAKELLKPKDYEILVLHAINEFTFKEISQIVSRPLGTVIHSYNSSIKKLRKGIIYEDYN